MMVKLLIVLTTLMILNIFVNRMNEDKEKRKAQEAARRANTPCFFDDNITEEEFERIVRKAVKSVKRITNVSVDGPVVYCTVRSQSGVSDWDFKLDFNDYGHITGNCWIDRDNYDSNIPDVVAERIQELL